MVTNILVHAQVSNTCILPAWNHGFRHTTVVDPSLDLAFFVHPDPVGSTTTRRDMYVRYDARWSHVGCKKDLLAVHIDKINSFDVTLVLPGEDWLALAHVLPVLRPVSEATISVAAGTPQVSMCICKYRQFFVLRAQIGR